MIALTEAKHVNRKGDVSLSDLENLPPEVLLVMISYLSINENGKLALISSLFWRLANDGDFWDQHTFLGTFTLDQKKIMANEFNSPKENIGKILFLKNNQITYSPNSYLERIKEKNSREKEKSIAATNIYNAMICLLFFFDIFIVRNDARINTFERLLIGFFAFALWFFVFKKNDVNNFYEKNTKISIKLVSAKLKEADYLELFQRNIVFFEKDLEAGFIFHYIDSGDRYIALSVVDKKDIEALQIIFTKSAEGEIFTFDNMIYMNEGRMPEAKKNFSACCQIAVRAFQHENNKFPRKIVLYQGRKNKDLCGEVAMISSYNVFSAFYDLVASSLFLATDDVLTISFIALVCTPFFYVSTYYASKAFANNLYDKMSVNFRYKLPDKNTTNFFSAFSSRDQVREQGIDLKKRY